MKAIRKLRHRAEKSRPMYLPLADNDIVPFLMCRGGVPCTGVLSRDDPIVCFSKRINETCTHLLNVYPQYGGLGGT